MNQEKEKSRNNSSAWAWAAAVIWLTKGGVPDTLLQLQPEKPTVHLITARPNQFLMEGWRGSQREREREGGQKNALRERRRCCSSRGWRIDKMVTVEDTLLVPLKAPFISFYWVTFTSKHLCLFVWGSSVWAEVHRNSYLCVRWKGGHNLHYVAAAECSNGSIMLLLLLLINVIREQMSWWIHVRLYAFRLLFIKTS